MLALHFPYCNHLCCNSSLIGYKVRKCTKKCISFDPRGVQQSTVTPIFLREDYIRSFEPCFIYQTWLRGIITNAIFVFENMRNQQKLTSSFFITFFYNGPRFGKTTTFKKKKFVHANFNSLHTDVFFHVEKNTNCVCYHSRRQQVCKKKLHLLSRQVFTNLFNSWKRSYNK